MMIRLLCFFAALWMLAPHSGVQAGNGPKTLIYSHTGNVGPLNPHLYSPNQMFGQAMVYEPLVRYEENGRIVPWLAESWAMEPDGLAWVFHLRKNVRFSDGTPFNADAVKMNLDAVLANRSRHEWLELATVIRRVEALDAFTIRLSLIHPYYPILEDLSLIRPFRFLSPSAFPENGNTAESFRAPVGTGPFKLVETRLGEYDRFERNNDYWGPLPDIERIDIRVISDPNTCAMAFETGEIDLIYGQDQISLDTFDRFRNDSRYISRTSSPMAYRNLAVNSNRGPTRDRSVRRAIQHAVNKDNIVSGIFLGTAEKVDTLLPQELPYCDVELEPIGFDPDQAGRLLEKAGWKKEPDRPFRMRDGQTLSVDIVFVGNNIIEKSIAEVMQGDLKKVGIQLILRGVEVDLFKKIQKNGEFNMVFNDTWGAPYEPHSYCSSMRVTSHGDCQAQSGLPMKQDIDRAILRALRTLDERERKDSYRYILSTLHDEAVYFPLCSINGLMVHRHTLGGVSFGATQYEIPFERIRINETFILSERGL
ncbi:nickel ABC transporter substrate-binding protein [Desulfatiferula olefinivorans]